MERSVKVGCRHLFEGIVRACLLAYGKEHRGRAGAFVAMHKLGVGFGVPGCRRGGVALGEAEVRARLRRELRQAECTPFLSIFWGK